MWSSLLGIFGKTIFWGLDLWIRRSKKNAEMTASYYEFLKQVDNTGAAKVANYLASEDALKSKQEELRKELEAQDEINPNKN